MITDTTIAMHTPGPWTCHVVIDGARDLSSQDIQPTYAINKNSLTPSWPVVSRAEAAANARLIAAAPDLLAALKNFQNYDLTLEERQNAAIAAIAKAEGR